MTHLLSQLDASGLLKDFGPVGGLAFIIILDKVGYYRKKSVTASVVESMREDQLTYTRKFDEAFRHLDDLHTWHAPDSDGEQSWKNKHMIELLNRIAEIVDRQTAVMDRHAAVMDRLVPILQRLEAKV